MTIDGTIIKVEGIREGTSERGPWKIATYVIETEERYPKRMVFDVSDGQSGRIERLDLKEGKRVTLFFDIDAHEYNGRYYNKVTGYDARAKE
jgi:hypothetical protein